MLTFSHNQRHKERYNKWIKNKTFTCLLIKHHNPLILLLSWIIVEMTQLLCAFGTWKMFCEERNTTIQNWNDSDNTIRPSFAFKFNYFIRQSETGWRKIIFSKSNWNFVIFSSRIDGIWKNVLVLVVLVTYHTFYKQQIR